MNHDLTDEDGRVAAAQAAGRNVARHEALAGHTEPRSWEKDGNPVAGAYSHLAAAGFSRIGARMHAITFRDAYVDHFYKTRLEYLRSQIEAEQISTAELIELQGLADRIDPGDNLLLEWAGVPEFREDIPENDRTTRAYWIGYHYGPVLLLAKQSGKSLDQTADELVGRAAIYSGWTTEELLALFRNENGL